VRSNFEQSNKERPQSTILFVSENSHEALRPIFLYSNRSHSTISTIVDNNFNRRGKPMRGSLPVEAVIVSTGTKIRADIGFNELWIRIEAAPG
jgi:hypothetical protein